jgi:uncharacterized membrane protein YeaQ/YmgE (transglycosylase-associated protein family)
MEIIWLIIIGAIVGVLGRLINPGPDPMGWILTIAIGIGSVLLVGLLLPDDWEFWRFVVAVIVAAVLVTLVQRVLPERAPRPGV